MYLELMDGPDPLRQAVKNNVWSGSSLQLYHKTSRIFFGGEGSLKFSTLLELVCLNCAFGFITHMSMNPGK